MKPLLILQARNASKRLPGKVMMPVNNMPMIYWQIRRIMKANVGDLIVATTLESRDDCLVEFLEENSVTYFRGSADNVAERFREILNMYSANYFFRLTGDCPMVMPELIKSMNDYYLENEFDYLSNTLFLSFPDGLDLEIIKTESFLKMFELELNQMDKEHVTQKIIKNPEIFKLANYKSQKDLSHLRWTVDYLEDFEFISRVFKYFEGREDEFNLEEALQATESGLIEKNTKSSEFRNIALRESE